MADENDIVYRGIDYPAIARAIGDFFGTVDFGGVLQTLGLLWNIYSLIALLVSLLLFVGFIYAKIRIAQLEEIESEHLAETEKAWLLAYGGAVAKNSRWDDVETHVASDTPSDWRLAIIEADILLEETLEGAGFVGVSIGEKLKNANPNSFATLKDAWDAHKVRNQIAHAGSDFVLTKRLAEETVGKYARVFREFGVI